MGSDLGILALLIISGEILVALAFLGLVIYMVAKGKIEWAGFLILLSGSLASFVISCILIFMNPLSESNLNYSAYNFLPILGSGILVTLAIVTLVMGKKNNDPPSSQPSWVRWVELVGSLLTFMGGICFFIWSIYIPQVFGYNTPVIKIGVAAFLALNVLACTLLYFFSTNCSSQRPNLLRWIAFFIAWSLLGYPTTFALMLIFAFPGNLTESVLVYASLTTMACIPPGLVIVALSRDHVR